MRRHIAASVETSNIQIQGKALPVPLLLPVSSSSSSIYARQQHSFKNSNSTSFHHRFPWVLNRKFGMLLFGFLGVTFILGVHLFLLFVMVEKHESKVSPHTIRTTAQDAAMAGLAKYESQRLAPLRDVDYDLYTIRINSWKRVDQLEASIQHHATCPGVAQIQVIWCNDQGEPPARLYENPKVMIERHSVNSLNERFHILEEPPTLGILSMDDDVLRSCEAIDTGFFKWVQNPERMVGFDARSHTVAEDGTWQYSYLSVTEKTNKYSLTLPRYAFLHRDYLNWYMTDLPRSIFDRVEKNFNCEDVAMSFFVSSLTNGKPPLLAHKWAGRWSQIKLYSKESISSGENHKSLRDACVNDFGDILGLKGTLKATKWEYSGWIDCGPKGRETNRIYSERQEKLNRMVSSWKDVYHVNEAIGHMKARTIVFAYTQGLITDSEPWKKRWHIDTKKKKKKEKTT